jgi:hypothetical protein
VNNRIGGKSGHDQCDEVRAVTLDALLADEPRIDVLKLDIEGAEVEILRSASAATFARVDSIRLEYHDGQSRDLAQLLMGLGFVVERHARGQLWVTRTLTARGAAA